MIFQEFYGAYYNCIAKILTKAVHKPVSQKEIITIIEENAFSESSIAIQEAIRQQNWQLLLPDGTTPLQTSPSMPMTTLQKRWLKSILQDKRIQLFVQDAEAFLMQLEDVPPLFTNRDYRIFDQYSDGDNYDDETYIYNFRMILNAIKEQKPLKIVMHNRSGMQAPAYVMPKYLEYSEKDNKFRLFASDGKRGKVINLARILSCSLYNGGNMNFDHLNESRAISVVLELVNERNALERVLMHFAHFEKNVKQIDNERYQIELMYQKDDESELEIRILSFGPMVKVTAPESFRQNMIERLTRQQRLGVF